MFDAAKLVAAESNKEGRKSFMPRLYRGARPARQARISMLFCISSTLYGAQITHESGRDHWRIAGRIACRERGDGGTRSVGASAKTAWQTAAAGPRGARGSDCPTASNV